MHTPQFGAAAQLRKYLAGVQQMLGVESTFDAHLLVKIGLVEHFRHQVALFDADAMFAGENPANLYAKPQDIRAEILRRLQFSRIVCVIKDERMKIAITRMEHISHTQAVFFRKRAHPREDTRQFLARNGAIHA